MTSKEIQIKLDALIANFNPQEFIYDLLLAYGILKTSVIRLKKGDFNLSKIDGEVLYKGKVFFSTANTDLHLKVDELATQERILKQKPRFIILTDFKILVAKDLKTKANIDIPITDLPNYYDFFLPLSGAEVYKSKNDNKADREASYQLAKLYDILVQDNPDYVKESHQLNLFLSRLLFCFFAEDTDIFKPIGVFTDALAQHTQHNGEDVDDFLNTLFNKLNTDGGNFPAYLQKFPYVNGGLFNDPIKAPKFTPKARQILLECGNLDWSEINPDIFGAMIQAVADPEERSDLGMHYTSVPNIKKLIEPLFLNNLREEFEKNRLDAKALDRLLIRISKIKFFDPACGSGNFLIITYKEIRLLEIEIIKQIIELSIQPAGVTDSSQSKIHFTATGHQIVTPAKQSKMNFSGTQSKIWFTEISLEQFYGIEIKDFAHEMAILSLWLAEHQMNKVFDDRLEGLGQSKPILPLKKAGNITCGNATRINWETVCPRNKNDEIYILGNPPYLGARLQNPTQKEDVAYTLKNVRGSNNLDYIAIWFYKAKFFIEGLDAKFAFVTTNSICQGEQVSSLWPNLLNDNLEIDFAYHSFKWTNSARGNAGVTVSIVAMRNKNNSPKYIYTTQEIRDVKNINPYLLDAPNAYILPRTKPLSKFPDMNFGNMPNDKGFLLLDENEKIALIQENKKSNFFIKKFAGATDFLNGTTKYCLWIKDVNFEESQSILSIKNRVCNVRAARLNSDREATQKLAIYPYKFGEIRHEETESIIIPRHSSENREYIPLGFLNADTIIADSALAIYDAQPWLFGILHSKMHMVWVNAVGGKLETRYRYSAKLCYNTFPFPDTNSKQKDTINQYVYDILDQRAKYPEKTMAWLYNPDTMPTGLNQAHKALDLCIEQIYRLAPFTNDAERLAYLFKLYEEMTKKDTLFAKVKKVKKVKEKVVSKTSN